MKVCGWSAGFHVLESSAGLSDRRERRSATAARPAPGGLARHRGVCRRSLLTLPQQDGENSEEASAEVLVRPSELCVRCEDDKPIVLSACSNQRGRSRGHRRR